MSALELNAEQLQMVKIIHDHVIRFPLTQTEDEQILQNCYDYMDGFKRVMDSTSRIQMEYICQQYDGIIDVPKDH